MTALVARSGISVLKGGVHERMDVESHERRDLCGMAQRVQVCAMLYKSLNKGKSYITQEGVRHYDGVTIEAVPVIAASFYRITEYSRPRMHFYTPQ